MATRFLLWATSLYAFLLFFFINSKKSIHLKANTVNLSRSSLLSGGGGAAAAIILFSCSLCVRYEISASCNYYVAF